MSCHEWPFGEPISGVIIVGSGAQDHGSGTHWRPHKELYITSSSGVQSDESLYVFEVIHFRFRSGASIGFQGQKERLVRWYSSGKKAKFSKRFLVRGEDKNYLPDSFVRSSLTVIPCRHTFPLFRKCYHGTSIKNSKAKEMVELKTHSIHSPMESAFGVKQRVPFGSQHRQVLHVTPC